MEEMKNKSNLSALLSFTNLLGLAVIIALSLVIKTLLDQRETVKDQNNELFAQVEKTNLSLNELTTTKESLEKQLKELEKKQGCDSYIKEISRLKSVEKRLSSSQSNYIQALVYTQEQAKEIEFLTEKVKILESIIGDNDQQGFPK